MQIDYHFIVLTTAISLFSLNTSKRVHRNDFEHLAAIAPLSLVNGLIHPYPTSALLLCYFLGRKAYTAGYYEKEGAFDKTRIYGSIAVNTVHVLTLLMSTVIAVRMIRGKLDLQKALQLTVKK